VTVSSGSPGIPPKDKTHFRLLSMQDAMGFGFGAFFSHYFLWGTIGLLMGVVHHYLMGFLAPNGSPTLSERLVEGVFLFLWPFVVSAHAASQAQDGGKPSLGDLLSLRHFFSVTFSIISLVAISWGGAYLLVEGFVHFFPEGVKPLSQTMTEPFSVSSGWILLALMALGGAAVAIPYSFGPFVALHEGEGFIKPFERSKYLSREIRIGLFFLHGFNFLIVCGGYLLFSKLSKGSTLFHHVGESIVIAALAGLVGPILNHAYRQAFALDEDPTIRRAPRETRVRVRIQDDDLSDQFSVKGTRSFDK
jgi:hypothetical protein